MILFFGLLRRVKGIEVLLEAFQSVDGAELWIVGMPRMPLGPLERLAESAPGRVRFLPRFVDEEEIPAIFRHGASTVCWAPFPPSGCLRSQLIHWWPG